MSRMCVTVTTLLGVFFTLACVTSPGKEDRFLAAGPDPVAWGARDGGVEPVFERRCGTLDCHGQVGRPLVIYGGNRLRLPNDSGLTAADGGTTDEEIVANYQSVVSLEPERMDRVVREHADPYSLLILKKPLHLEGHKGGPGFVLGDDIEVCISTWLRGAMTADVAQKCARAAAGP